MLPTVLNLSRPKGSVRLSTRATRRAPRGAGVDVRESNAYRVGSPIFYVPSASISAFKFSVAVSNCFLVKRTITGSASLKKPRLSPR